MFAKALLFALSAIAGLVVAAPNGACNTGSIQCCQSVQSSSSPSTISILKNAGIPVPTIETLVGVTCSPVVGVLSGTSCSAQPVCCSNNNFKGVVALGCTAINV